MDQSIMYVDVENLQEIAKQTLIAALKNWPPGFPNPSAIKLYTRADQTEMWRIWAIHNIPPMEIIVKGVQHYAFSGSKNSADLSLALDALADLLKGRTKYVAVLSDDSDYVSLFTALQQETNSLSTSKAMFKWFMTDRSDTRSQILLDFFPSEYIHVIACSPALDASESIEKKPPLIKETFSEEEGIARAIIKNIPVGPFKSSDCKKIIIRVFPNNKMGKQDSASFGTHFSKLIWPILERYGVKLPNPNKKPRKYEMTEEAKKIVT